MHSAPVAHDSGGTHPGSWVSKLRLSEDDRHELLADYLPYCEIVEQIQTCPHLCRDEKDKPFLNLAQAGGASLLVSGDKDLLVMAGLTDFQIETPEAYRLRVAGDAE